MLHVTIAFAPIGPITNAFITLAPANMLNPDSKPRVPLPKFSRHLHSTESMENSAREGLTLCLGLHQKVRKHKEKELARDELASHMWGVGDLYSFGQSRRSHSRWLVPGEAMQILNRPS